MVAQRQFKSTLRIAFVGLITSVFSFVVHGESDEDTIADTDKPMSPGVFSDRILFGQSAAFSGPAAELGVSIKAGILAAFKEVNDAGGINGRRLVLRSLDDMYEPEVAIANTQQLIKDGVFALIGAVGTPTSRSTVPIAELNNVPYIAPMTGAEFLRDSERRTVVNLRASYYQETEEMVERLTSDLGIVRIAILHQDDSFGRAGYQGVVRALKRRNLAAVGTGVFSRNTVAVKTALIDLMGVDPEAVIIVGPYQPTATFIKWAHRLKLKSVFMTLSFVGSNALVNELGVQGTGVLVTQVVPFPTGDTVRASQSFRTAIEAYDSEIVPGFVSFEGYLAGRLAAHIVEQCGNQVERDCVNAVLQRGDEVDLDGFLLQYGKNDNQGSDSVFLTLIGEDGKYAPVTSLKSVPSLLNAARTN